VFNLPGEPSPDGSFALEESAQRTGEEHFRELAETIEDVFWVTNLAKTRMFYVSPAYERIWGRSCRSLYDQPFSWLDAVHAEDRERVRHAALSLQSVRDTSGQVERVVGIARDITEYLQIREQLRHSQKMDAIGQLAGGVAHDFNNILAAIMLQADLTVHAHSLPKEVHDALKQIRFAAGRAARLVRQLLLFSRKQIMPARNLDLNEVVTHLSKMIQRIIGESVHLQLHLHPRPLVTCADAAMVDQVLINLAVNARDAMPAGGPLLVQTDEINVTASSARSRPETAPGRYVRLSVSDTGVGIAPEILPRIFEPFFTTKEPGKGTGLGLATVFGIVKQHGGFIDVESEVGRGSIFHVCLPATDAAPEPLARPDQPRSCGGTETILLVEDDEPVRMFIHAMLKRYGYHVLEAPNGVQALKLWDEHRGSIALLLTDLVMPAGVSGQELASKMQQDKPQLKVIFTSGYSAEIAGQQIEFQLGEEFLQKPFPPDQLLETIRRCLDD